jgi:hypothetical protein
MKVVSDIKATRPVDGNRHTASQSQAGPSQVTMTFELQQRHGYYKKVLQEYRKKCYKNSETLTNTFFARLVGTFQLHKFTISTAKIHDCNFMNSKMNPGIQEVKKLPPVFHNFFIFSV